MRYLFIVLTVLFFQSCDLKMESVHFTEPQPTGIENSSGFNKRYQGKYLNTEDSSYLTITPNKIIRYKKEAWVYHKTELDSSFMNKKDEEIIQKLLSEGVQSVVLKDSVFCTWEYRDTMFQISPETSLRYYKNSFFLNTKNDGSTWEVGRLDLNKGVLSLGYIYPNDSLFSVIAIDSISEIKNDSGQVVNYQMKPTKKELKKLMREDAFTDVYKWVKIKE